MIELIVLDYLKNALDVPVVMEEPADAEEFVLISKTGSGEENFIKNATFAVQSWAKSLYDAAVLNEKVIEAMAEIIELNEISKSSLNSDYEFTDTTTKHYRYQAVFDLVY